MHINNIITMRIQPTTLQRRQIDNAESFFDLHLIAQKILEFREPMAIVCGPISGPGSREENLRQFDATIEVLADSGVDFFDQMPFENRIGILVARYFKENPNEEYCMPLLETLYRPIFSSGKIKRAYFLPGWENSTGASWEHALCKERYIQIVYLPTQWSSCMDVSKYSELNLSK